MSVERALLISLNNVLVRSLGIFEIIREQSLLVELDASGILDHPLVNIVPVSASVDHVEVRV